MMMMMKIRYLVLGHGVEVVAGDVKCHVLFDWLTFLQQQRAVLNSTMFGLNQNLYTATLHTHS